ncbi:hypothetical protein HMPREF1550_01077, partial [Actinomyces sp. oral taxon 877 str. F0543]
MSGLVVCGAGAGCVACVVVLCPVRGPRVSLFVWLSVKWLTGGWV